MPHIPAGHLFFEDNAGAINNPERDTGESTVAVPVAKECVELYPRIASTNPVQNSFAQSGTSSQGVGSAGGEKVAGTRSEDQ